MFRVKKWAILLTITFTLYIFLSQYNEIEKTKLRAITASDNVLAYFNHYSAFKIQQNSKANYNYNQKLLLNYNDHGSIFNKFLDDLITLLKEQKLHMNLLEKTLNVNLDNDFVKWIQSPDSVLSKGYLMSLTDKQLIYSKVNFKRIKKSHAQFVKSMPKLTERFYSGRGYVMIGGFKERNWLSTISLMSLVRTGARIPTEVMIFHQDDYEADFCNLIAPSYNARCVKAYEIFGKERTKFFLDNFNLEELKILAILISSFQDVMYLNANTFVINNPDEIFSSRVYKTYRMITWPDFERRTTSPVYYDITGSKIDENKSGVRFLNDILTFNRDSMLWKSETSEPKSEVDKNYHDKQGTIPDWSTFDDLVLINKVQFFDTLILALYYSMNGPNVYYPLLSQVVIHDDAYINGKEVLAAAANYFGLSYYQLFKKPDLDFSNDDETKSPLGVLQYNPQDDFEVFTNLIEHISAKEDEIQQKKNEAEQTRLSLKDIYNIKFESNKGVENNPLMPLFFNSADGNKFFTNPFNTYEKLKKDISSENNNADVNLDSLLKLVGTRVLSNAFPRSKFDYEQYIWKIAKMIICDEKLKFKQFEENDINGLCNDFIDLHIAELDKNEEQLAMNYYDRVKNGNIKR